MEERMKTIDRLLQQLPTACFEEVPILESYLTDKSSVVQRIREKADMSEKKSQELPTEWAIDVVKNAPSLVIVVDGNKRILYANKLARKMFGLHKKTMRETEVQSFAAPGYRELLCEVIDGERKELLVMQKGNEKIAFKAHAHSMGHDKPVVLTLTLPEEKISSNTTLAVDMVWDSLPVAILSLKGTIVSYNSLAKKLLNPTSQELLFSDLFISPDRVSKHVREALNSKNSSVSRSHVLKDTQSTLKVSLRAMKYELIAENRNILAILEDITDYVTVQKGYEFMEDVYEKVFNVINESMMALDEEGTIVLANEKAAELFGHSKADIMGHNIRFLFKSSSIDSLLEAKSVVGQHKNGSIFTVSIHQAKKEEKLFILNISSEKEL